MKKLWVAFLALALGATTSLAQDYSTAIDTTDASPAPKGPFLPEPEPHALRALGEITLVNGIVWSYNRFIRPGGGQGFRIGLNSWEESIENGWDWDPNNFNTNQYAHPYHGNLYYNAARSNGFNYWSSMGFAFVGSFQWEYFGETHHPSINDWINTSMGGTALGEMFHRLATTVRDNEATGGARFWSELGGFVIDPVGAFNRLVTGDMGKVQPNPELHTPPNVSVIARFGARTTYESHIPQADTTGGFVNFNFRYGDLFQHHFEHPYDVFDANMQLNFNDTAKLGVVHVGGLLERKRLGDGDHSRHMLGLYQYYDYLNNRAFELGGQSIGAGLTSRFRPGDGGIAVQTNLTLSGLILAATKSDYVNQTSRSYDYGPGLGASFSGALLYGGTEVLSLAHGEYYIHSVNGNRADHFLSLSRVAAAYPLNRNLSIGGDYSLYLADRHYADFPDVSERSPELNFWLRTRL